VEILLVLFPIGSLIYGVTKIRTGIAQLNSNELSPEAFNDIFAEYSESARRTLSPESMQNLARKSGWGEIVVGAFFVLGSLVCLLQMLNDLINGKDVSY
jgi:uncharacterized membrane protein YphA (DoxX/SURF4 family)